ncbi:hypothetical protein H8S20_08710 [Clostridium sp. NSJ-6]|uniref:Uncharacterized protein n=1 Tax=Clostridium hominis TaxID=2763036 RepID=A0ABR7DC44_9CLOT|nr:hypothetical protein [Clostridium hominis]MBC5628971.1 hypothetical protein [Clostridium hominis]MDU2671968.1 hypothetical protein [Clostridium sp.]
MKDRYKLTIIHLILFISALGIGVITEKPYRYVNEFSWVILLVNTMLFLILIKQFKVKENSIIKYLLIILGIFIILIIDKDYFYSSYIQSTPDIIFPYSILILSNVLIVPFVFIFDCIYTLNLFNISFIIIPLYIIILMIASKKVLKLNGKRE